MKLTFLYCFKDNIRIESCSEDIDLDKYNIKHGKCIDDELISRIIGVDFFRERSNQRLSCGCIKSIDIGAYNTCRHNCHCYANFNKCGFENTSFIMLNLHYCAENNGMTKSV